MSKSGCFIAEEEYLGDILWWVRVREKCQGVTSLTSPQLGRSLVITVGEGCLCQEYSFRRRQLISWTCEISARLGLTTQTVHMAVR